MTDEEMEKLIKEYEEYAEEKGFKLNPDRKIVEGVVKALIMRKENFGEKYCPCRKMSNDKKADKNIICPCVYHLEEIEKAGHCFCNLFFKDE
ncbi:MAG: ferredoxin-thioredoxin reductase catalytic domain-containing protein [Candidatus Paceibacterota bacterium]|jgi:ferredoxin-thioredoxin reductase catalytic subunit